MFSLYVNGKQIKTYDTFRSARAAALRRVGDENDWITVRNAYGDVIYNLAG
jgi:hypothetical protein